MSTTAEPKTISDFIQNTAMTAPLVVNNGQMTPELVEMHWQEYECQNKQPQCAW